MGQKTFESRHVEKYLGIKKNQLFHWTQTKRLVKPKIEGKGRGGRSKFDFAGLLNLALIKELSNFGLELNAIKDILRGNRMAFRPDSDGFVLDKGRTPWAIFKKNRKNYIKSGLLLEIVRMKNNYYWVYMSGKQRKNWVEGYLPNEQGSLPIAKLVIDVSQLVTELEYKTGIKL